MLAHLPLCLLVTCCGAPEPVGDQHRQQEHEQDGNRNRRYSDVAWDLNCVGRYGLDVDQAVHAVPAYQQPVRVDTVRRAGDQSALVFAILNAEM